MPNQLGLRAKKRPDLVVCFVVAHFVTIILKGVGSNYIITLFRALPLTIFFTWKRTTLTKKSTTSMTFSAGIKQKNFWQGSWLFHNTVRWHFSVLPTHCVEIYRFFYQFYVKSMLTMTIWEALKFFMFSSKL